MDSGFSGVIKSRYYDKASKELALKAAQESSIARGLARVFGIDWQTAYLSVIEAGKVVVKCGI